MYPAGPVHKEPWFWIVITLGALFKIAVAGICLVVLIISVSLPLDELVMDRPTVSEMAGTYHLTDGSRDTLGWYYGYDKIPDCEVQLREDGTVSVRNLPRDYSGQEEPNALESFEGTWLIVKDTEGWGYKIEVESSPVGGDVEYFSTEFDLGGAHYPHVLQYSWGDPDEFNELEFTLASN